MVTQRGQVAPKAAKGFSSSKAAEATGDLLLHFDHPKISLGQIVIKIHPQILQEGQDRLLAFAQPIQQIAGGTLFASPSCSGRRKSMRVKPIPFSEQLQEAGLPISDFQRVKPLLSLLTCLLCGF